MTVISPPLNVAPQRGQISTRIQIRVTSTRTTPVKASLPQLSEGW